MSTITRFAPSPTGYLHIGGARTALFNWLYARHHGGSFLLRIEDTDRLRSTKEAVDAIFDGLHWLGLDADEEPVYQSLRADRHIEIANELLKNGLAYYCYCSPEELTEMRATAKREGKPVRYDGRWRDRGPSEAPTGVKPTVRFKSPLDGTTLIHDLVQKDVTVENAQLDDMVLLRADGTPTYMLSVVVDDHDMGITDVIRGDDHLTNAFRQTQIYRALSWPTPKFAHLPLIHGPDGSKLSKRHGAIGVDAYREMGILPEALRNYLLRLGWSHGDEEIIPTDRAIEWFDLDAVGRSSARIDLKKLENLNGHYLREEKDARLVGLIAPKIEGVLDKKLTTENEKRLLRAMPGLKARAKDLNELAENATFYVRSRPIPLNKKAEKLLNEEGRAYLAKIAARLDELDPWKEDVLEAAIQGLAEAAGIKLGKLAQPLRAGLTGSNASPGIFEVMAILGKTEVLNRLRDTLP
ncbi:glutamate--tRNA ligase [Rhodospirillaceae bacterium AH-315-P19]|nr:glutamate--tRNA ligase [Rhodospirillaceae bacterium AH-315-P19]